MSMWPGQTPQPDDSQRQRTSTSSRRDQSEQPTPWMPPNAQNTPNAEKYLLEADAMRRRQLRSAVLHGSSRTWREHRRVWPAVVAGIIVVAVILAAFTVANAIKETQQEQQEEEASSSSTSSTVTQTVTGSPEETTGVPSPLDSIPTSGTSGPQAP